MQHSLPPPPPHKICHKNECYFSSITALNALIYILILLPNCELSRHHTEHFYCSFVLYSCYFLQDATLRTECIMSWFYNHLLSSPFGHTHQTATSKRCHTHNCWRQSTSCKLFFTWPHWKLNAGSWVSHTFFWQNTLRYSYLMSNMTSTYRFILYSFMNTGWLTTRGR